MPDSIHFKSGHSLVNGIELYYEMYGQGEPLVLIHGGGSTIQTSFAALIPMLLPHYTVIAMDLQNHGRSGFRDVPQTFEQDADDIAALLKNIGISKASFLGFSNGGTTAFQIALRYPEIVHKLVLAAAVYQREGLINGFFDAMLQATLDNMPMYLKESFLKVNPDTNKLQLMFEKDRDRMIAFKDYTNEQLRSVKAPTLIINGDKDVVTTEHSVKMYRLMQHAELAIVPGGHGKYIGEGLTAGSRDVEFVVPMIRQFLNKKDPDR